MDTGPAALGASNEADRTLAASLQRGCGCGMLAHAACCRHAMVATSLREASLEKAGPFGQFESVPFANA